MPVEYEGSDWPTVWPIPPQIDDDWVSATLYDLGDGIWELSITNKASAENWRISTVVFPHFKNDCCLNGDASSEIVYEAALSGIAHRGDSKLTFGCGGEPDYPGELFSPLTIVSRS